MVLDLSFGRGKTSFLLYSCPDSLKKGIIRASQKHYEELYESEADKNISLEESISDILELFQQNDQSLSHIRFVWMALILVIAVEPTIQYYQPSQKITEKVINYLKIWLLINVQGVLNNQPTILSQEIDKEIQKIGNIHNLFSESKSIASFQILSEAFSTYKSAIKTLNYDQSLEALLDILEDCLEGYAIFPGSEGRRELFDWWLADAVPSSWYLRTPNSFYFLKKVENGDEIEEQQMKKLTIIREQILAAMLTIYLFRQNVSTEDNPNYNHYSNFTLNNIQVNRKLTSKSSITKSTYSLVI